MGFMGWVSLFPLPCCFVVEVAGNLPLQVRANIYFVQLFCLAARGGAMAIQVHYRIMQALPANHFLKITDISKRPKHICLGIYGAVILGFGSARMVRVVSVV